MRRALLVPLAIVIAALAAAACAGETEVVEKIVEVPVVEEVIKEVEVEKIVEVETEKIVEVERIVEVETEKVLIATPTPLPTGEPRFGGTLRVVSQASIATLDPSTPFYVTIAVAQHIYETALGWDRDLNDKARMVESWSLSPNGLTYTFELRDGLSFHNGSTVGAEDVTESILRWAGGGSPIADMFQGFAAEEPVTVVDERTWTINLNAPFSGVITGLARPFWSPTIMPKELASTPPEEVVAEFIGSGVYKFAKWDVGHQVILERHGAYVPRNEPPNHMVGGTIAYIDRVIWLEIPDEETKIAGLQTGEWDVVDTAGFDFFKRVTADPNIAVPLYKPGFRSSMNVTPNNPPFGNESMVMTEANLAARRAVQAAIDIEAVMLGLGDRDLWILCPAIYYCGTPLETNAGEEYYNINDKDLARRLLAESGYADETLTLLNPTDLAVLTPTGIVIKAELEEIGMNIEMPALDWSTIVSKFSNVGEYHFFTDAGVHWGGGDPVSWPIRSGVPGRHPVNEEGIELRTQYAQATDPALQRELLDKIQINMYEDVTWMFLGQFFPIFPHTKDLKNFEVLAIPFYANTWLER